MSGLAGAMTRFPSLLPATRRADVPLDENAVCRSDGSIDPDVYFARRLIVHPHLPKTGGTTFVEGLSAIFGADRVYDLRGQVDSLKHMSRDRRGAIGVLSGHFWFDTEERIFRRPKVYFMCLRDPVDRFVSLYNYVARSQNHPAHGRYGVLDIENALEYLKRKSAVEIADSVTAMFGARWPTPPSWRGHVRRKGERVGFEIARARMEECFALVIPMARVESALKQIATTFGRGNMEFPRKNVGIYATRAVPEDVRAKLIAMNREDIDLIDYFTDVFDERLAGLRNRLLDL